MKIIIVGDGKVGATLAEQLSREGHDITMIDKNSAKSHRSGETLDIMSVEGNGAILSVQKEAGVEKADLLIAATSSDELNMLCCLVAKKTGARHTIARVRDPEYDEELNLFREDLGLSMAVNPELACASEMARLLRFPSAIKVDTFARNRAELLEVQIPPQCPLVGMQLKQLSIFRTKVLVAVVVRGEHEVHIPSGEFCLQAGDRISVAARPAEAAEFFKKINISTGPVHQAMIVGGGKIAFYLAKQLVESHINVKIIDSDLERCRALAELLPDATIIHGDGTDQELLREEGLAQMDAFASLTGIDEENILLSLYAKHHSKAKVLTKLNRISFLEIFGSTELGSVYSPRYIAAEAILRYVRGMQNSYGSKIETLCRIANDRAEALEFRVSEQSAVCGVPLMELKFKKNLLICCINRGGKILTPKGQDTIQPNDTVIVVTTNTGFSTLDDILEKKRG
ncbi:MAG: Trk system potassium transporter TrkA [Oscillospiraceae bacterium]|nr:Trk system potassium transporter TrkA [Oscillospiraceae bacterium]